MKKQEDEDEYKDMPDLKWNVKDKDDHNVTVDDKKNVQTKKEGIVKTYQYKARTNHTADELANIFKKHRTPIGGVDKSDIIRKDNTK